MSRAKKTVAEDKQACQKYMLEREGTHFRLVAAKEFWCGDYFVKRGSRGGLIDSELNLSCDGTCWITEDACVYGDASVVENALITGRAIVCGKAVVGGDAIIEGDSQVCGRSRVFGGAIIGGSVELVNTDIDGSIIKYNPNAGMIHINKYNRPHDLVIKIKTVVIDGKDKREDETEEQYRKRKVKEHKNTYVEFCRIVGK